MPFIILIFGPEYSGSQNTKTQKSEEGDTVFNASISPPPSSLDILYPPQAKEPVYLIKMIELGTFFSGIVADVFENDFQNVEAGFERFKTKYVEVSKLIPEWEKEYPMNPVNELKMAIESGEQGKIMASIEKVGKGCHECHIWNMAKVQQKYHWGNFEEIKIKDPLTNGEISFAQLKLRLNANFAGIGLDVEQGEKENAKKQMQAFKARFQALKSTCQHCHEKRAMPHYADQEVISLIEYMDLELSRSTYNPKKIVSLIQKIGTESCFKCHLVHIPSAYAKLQWKK